ncbi:SprT family protein [Barrientosiimonas marina]|uniref:Protein SprT-like n=1 Tax=Lentibacillus kimchii TaxID=1542911 RepID=A0ABW2UYB0_9BACI
MNSLNEAELYNLVDRLSRHYFHKPFSHDVIFNHRLRTTGGRYMPAAKTIELNPKYVLESSEEEVMGILKHELCHYHLHIEGKGYRHGDRDFKALLKQTGSPRHCSPLPSAEKRPKYRYQCGQCGYIYERIRRINLTKYRCGKCRGQLVMLNGGA